MLPRTPASRGPQLSGAVVIPTSQAERRRASATPEQGAGARRPLSLVLAWTRSTEETIPAGCSPLSGRPRKTALSPRTSSAPCAPVRCGGGRRHPAAGNRVAPSGARAPCPLRSLRSDSGRGLAARAPCPDPRHLARPHADQSVRGSGDGRGGPPTCTYAFELHYPISPGEVNPARGGRGAPAWPLTRLTPQPQTTRDTCARAHSLSPEGARRPALSPSSAVPSSAYILRSHHGY